MEISARISKRLQFKEITQSFETTLQRAVYRRRLQTFHTHIRVNRNGMPIEDIDAVSSRSEKEKTLNGKCSRPFRARHYGPLPAARPHPPVRHAFGLVLLEYAAHASRTAPLASAHKKMSDELLAQYRRGAHIRTRSPRMDMGKIKQSSRQKAQYKSTNRSRSPLLTIDFYLFEGSRCGVTIRTQGGVVE